MKLSHRTLPTTQIGPCSTLSTQHQAFSAKKITYKARKNLKMNPIASYEMI